MCGIAGLVDLRAQTSEEDLQTLVRTMSEPIRHRGPDDFGSWVDASSGAALAQRRLAIIDLSPTGHQPMWSRDNRCCAVFNGEIYNFREVRARLEAEGRTFRGHSDTQVITEGCRAWGFEKTLQTLNGMFAIALWDREKRRLHLARDRMGEKPLYYGRVGHWFLFGSELKALLAHPGWKPRIDPTAANLFFRYNYIPGARTIFEGIYKLLPGHHLAVSAKSEAEVLSQPYWSVAEAAESGLSNPLPAEPAGVLEGLESLLDDAVRIRLEADVPIGALLSGGIDSSLVVALMTRHAGSKVRTFSVGFAEEAYDESTHARNVAEYLGTEHTEFRVSPSDALAVVEKLPVMYDEPFADSSQIPTHLISSLARQHVTVALSGDAGDELFAGYHRYAWGESLWSRLGWAPSSLRRAVASMVTRLSPAQIDGLWRVLGPALPRALRVSTPGDRIHKLCHVIRAENKYALYDQLLTNLSDHTTPGEHGTVPIGGISWTPPIDDYVNWMVALDMVGYLPDDILVKVDRATMAVSLESRAPFLDHRLVEFSWRVPKALKVRGTTGKWLTRQLLYKLVPRELVDRPKQGFGVPIDEWLRGPLLEWAHSLLSEEKLRESGMLDTEHVARRWREHLSGERNWAPFLWSVLMFEAWREVYRPGV